jgi:hypothetical protein
VTLTIGDTASDFEAETTEGRFASTIDGWASPRRYIRIVPQPDCQPAGSRGA